jgi:3-oxoacyl-[acyl-carrier-protein] synthase III
MYINTISHYLPKTRLSNAYFQNINGLSDEWIYSRTGIRTRSRASKEDTTETMARQAVLRGLETLPYDISETDLIIAASYTPVDTIATLAHYIQKSFFIENTKALYISTACSSFVNAVEIAEGYFASGKASKILIVVSEHNSLYNDDKDRNSGHLWGDGAAAVFLSKEPYTKKDPHIIDVQTSGLATVGKGPEGVTLKPKHNGLRMSYGKDVFVNACHYMASEITDITSKNKLSVQDIAYIIPHQANVRIINNVASKLNVPENKMVINIDRYGNTGSAGALIALSESREKIREKDIVGITVFGGGYSSGAMLIRF